MAETRQPAHADTVEAARRPPTGVKPGALLEGRYRLISRLGVGGMSEVWRAVDQRLEREVAAKLLGESTREGKFEARLRKEATTIAKLRHPNIVDVYDAGTDEQGRPFLVMELLEGEPLSDRLARRGGLGASEAVRALLPVAEALAHAHAQGVIHRDLKPANVFFANADRGEIPKLLDFGIARLMDPASDVTAGWIGTPEFMAPEQLDLGRRLTPAVDQWAFAALLYEAATGGPPFRGEEMGALFEAIRDAPLPFPRSGGVDGRLFRILTTATRKAPEDRYDSVGELAAALRGWLGTRDPREAVTLSPQADAEPRESQVRSVDRRKVDPKEVEPRNTLDDAIRGAFGGGDS